jgi:formate dehydrogenase assembly factor FdhD
MVWVEREVVLLECPFCHKNGVKYLYHPASIRAQTSRSAVAKSTKFIKIREKYEIMSGCKFCGKSKKEIRKAMEEGTPKDKEKRKKRYEEIMKLREELRRERKANKQ